MQRLGTVSLMLSVVLCGVIVVNLVGVGWPMLVPVGVAAASYIAAVVRRAPAR